MAAAYNLPVSQLFLRCHKPILRCHKQQCHPMQCSRGLRTRQAHRNGGHVNVQPTSNLPIQMRSCLKTRHPKTRRAHPCNGQMDTVQAPTVKRRVAAQCAVCSVLSNSWGWLQHWVWVDVALQMPPQHRCTRCTATGTPQSAVRAGGNLCAEARPGRQASRW